MSVVACRILPEGGFEMAADSITVRGYTQTIGNGNFSKLIEINGMVIGTVGSIEEGSLFQLFAQTRRPSAPEYGPMLEYIADFSAWKAGKTNDGSMNNAYLIGVQGRVFIVHEWMIQEVKTFEAIGAGEDFALAALHLGHNAADAVRTAVALSVYCEEPVQVIRKEGKE